MKTFATSAAMTGTDASASTYQPLAAGDQPMFLREYEDKDTDSGGMIKAIFEVAEGPNQDKYFYLNYNYANANPDTVTYALRDLKKLVIACGFDGDQDLSEQVLDACTGVTFIGRLVIKKAKPGSDFGDSNNIQEYYNSLAYGEGLAAGTIKQKKVVANTVTAPKAGNAGAVPPPKPTAPAAAPAAAPARPPAAPPPAPAAADLPPAPTAQAAAPAAAQAPGKPASPSW